MSNPTGFSPSTIASNLALWLDSSQSDSITTSGTSVTQWLDRSGSNFVCISNIFGNPLPTYSNVSPYPYVRFTDNQTMYVNTWGYTTGWTCFVCLNSVSLGERWLISPFQDVSLVMMSMNAGNSKIWNGLLPGAPSDLTGNHIENTSASNTGTTAPLYWYRDGTLQISNNTNANVAANATARLGIGGNASLNASRGGTYNIYEIIIYKNLITDTQRQQVEGYLAWKWGMTGNLPTSHPYKNFPFVITPETVPRDIPTSAFVVPINTYSTIKTFTLPTVSTNPGRMLILKDYLGYASFNNIYLSTTGLDRIERPTVSSMILSNSYGAWTFMNDGITNWFLTHAYLNTLGILGAPIASSSTSNLVFSHPDGRTWKVSGTNVRLNSGTQASLWLYNNSNVFSNADGAVGILNSNNLNQAVRHAGFTMFYNTFSANNFDFAWKFFRSGTGYNIFNYYSAPTWVGYDSASDTVLIVGSGDARRVTWNITPALPSQFVYT